MTAKNEHAQDSPIARSGLASDTSPTNATASTGGDTPTRSNNPDAPGAPNEPADALSVKLGELHQEIKKAGEALAGLERRGRIDRAVIEARAVDHAMVAKFVEQALARTPDAPIERVINELKRDRPAMFRPARGPWIATAMSPGHDNAPANAGINALRQRAMSGDRLAMAQYLRARRG